jgi:hypothetical protein
MREIRSGFLKIESIATPTTHLLPFAVHYGISFPSTWFAVRMRITPWTEKIAALYCAAFNAQELWNLSRDVPDVHSVKRTRPRLDKRHGIHVNQTLSYASSSR